MLELVRRWPIALFLLGSLGCGSRTRLLGEQAPTPDVSSGGTVVRPSAGGSGGVDATSGTGARGPSGGASSVAPVGIAQVEAGGWHSCALLTNGKVRCWGDGFAGLGYGNQDSIGDDETPASAGDIDVGGTVVSITLGTWHTCALLATGNVRCWGGNLGAGYPNVGTTGDDETPASRGDVDVGGKVTAIAAGAQHTCAILEQGRLRCWGQADSGRLGGGNTMDVGDNETPASVPEVDVGGYVVSVAGGSSHTCALLDTGAVRCFGFGPYGALGYGNAETIGDDETPASVGDIDLGGQAVQITAGDWHTCALLDTGNVRCWGFGGVGSLGYGNTNDIGDDESPASAGDVDVGGTVVQIVGGKPFTCALLATGAVRCWGDNASGALGYGNGEIIGDDETPASVGDVDVGESVVQLDANAHVCALLASGNVKCWGYNANFQLGMPGESIGDDETPASIPVLQILDP